MGFEELLTKSDLATIEKMITAAVAKLAPMESPWLTLKEAAEYCKDKPRTFWEKVHNGDIAHIREGKNYKFSRADLDEYMKAHRVMSNREITAAVAGK